MVQVNELSSPSPNPLVPNPQSSGLGLTKTLAGGQQERGHEVVHQDQGEHLQLLLLHHFQNASNQGKNAKQF